MYLSISRSSASTFANYHMTATESMGLGSSLLCSLPQLAEVPCEIPLRFMLAYSQLILPLFGVLEYNRYQIAPFGMRRHNMMCRIVVREYGHVLTRGDMTVVLVSR